ncbi:MAG TPA: RDD family protein [Alphaproteobacteria bacterium]|nr:RDD family protein [Alphaproteobacteria bacterium]
MIADEGVVGLLLAAWGTTPGKWLLNMAVERQDGTAIDFGSALRRSFAVWLRGLGGGLPVVSLRLPWSWPGTACATTDRRPGTAMEASLCATARSDSGAA